MIRKRYDKIFIFEFFSFRFFLTDVKSNLILLFMLNNVRNADSKESSDENLNSECFFTYIIYNNVV